MAITKYTKPMQQEFVPKPWEQMYKMQMLKRQEFEAAENMLDTGYDLLSSVRATGEEDKALLSTERQRYDKVIKEAISGAGGDLSLLPRVAKNIARDIRGNIQSGKLYDINRKTSQIAQASELTNKMRSTGKLNDIDYHFAQKQHIQGTAYVPGESKDWKQDVMSEMESFGQINKGVTYDRVASTTRDYALTTHGSELQKEIQYIMDSNPEITQEKAQAFVMNKVNNLAGIVARKETVLSSGEFNPSNISNPFTRKEMEVAKNGLTKMTFDEIKGIHGLDVKDPFMVGGEQLVTQLADVYGIIDGTSDKKMSYEKRAQILKDAKGIIFPGANRHKFIVDESTANNTIIVDDQMLTKGFIYVSKIEFDSDTEMEGFFKENKDDPNIIQRVREMKDPLLQKSPDQEWYRVSVMLKTDYNSQSAIRNYNEKIGGLTKRESNIAMPNQIRKRGEFKYVTLESKRLKSNPTEFIKNIKSNYENKDGLYEYLDKLAEDKSRHNYNTIIELQQKLTQ